MPPHDDSQTYIATADDTYADRADSNENHPKSPPWGLNLRIRGRLIAGFAVVCILLVAIVGTAIFEAGGIRQQINRIHDLRVPTANASGSLVRDIYASLASLRGWMLTGNERFKTERAAVWANIDAARTEMDTLAQNWTNPENVTRWTAFKDILNEFRTAQARVETIAHSPDEQPASKILFEQAAPRGKIMITQITAMIDEEMTRPATAERRVILGAMADVRGTTGVALANIRAYLLSGDKAFATAFEKIWSKNVRRFADLGNMRHLMSPSQATAFDALAKSRSEFLPLPARMFAIRGSEQWNMANYTLVTEAAPRAGKLLDILLGAMNADGIRAGGMVDNQRLLLGDDVASSVASSEFLEMAAWVLLVIGLAVSAVIVFFTARSIVNPIAAMTGAMDTLAGGKLDVDIPALDKTDEIGEMAQAVQVFKDNAIRVKRMEQEQEEQKRYAEEERREAMQQMADTFENSVGDVIQVVTSAATELQASSGQMAATATQTSSQATTVASASEEAATNVQTVAAATEQLSGSISEIASQVARSTQIADQAVTEARSTSDAVERLSDNVGQIGEVVDLINDIAEQTNLLALNATIEAARAGDAGKGFAVVASEVKNLASQTAKATDEIARQIGDVQSGTQSAKTAIESISGVIEQISETSSSIASAVEEQTAATGEIARNVEQASVGTSEVSSSIAKVEQAAGETGSAANQIKDSAHDLSRQSEILREEVGKFLDQVRSDKDHMALVEWDPELACGVDSIDAHHKQLFDTFNRFHGKMVYGEGFPAAQALAANIGDDMENHFREEEALMGRLGYPDLALHQKQHKGFRERFGALRQKMDQGDRASGMDLYRFVTEWLTGHVMTSDRTFIEFCRETGNMEQLDRAA